MAKNTCYAVRKGRKTGIFDTWDETKKLITGYNGAEFRGFPTRKEAEDWLNLSVSSKQTEQLPEHSYAYVDGSYNPKTEVYGCGGFLIDQNGTKHIIMKSGNEESMRPMRNVAGEILGCMEAARLALKLRMSKLYIYYDYHGIKKWVTGEWQANNPETQKYQKTMKTVMSTGIEIEFRKVKGHTGIEGNEEADRLAKEAVGVCVGSKRPNRDNNCS